MLITANDIRKFRPIAANTDDTRRIDMYIQEVENVEVVPALGAALYKQVTNSPGEHTLLLEGGYYDNDTKRFAGLKAAISLLAYARFVLNNNINVTPFGVKEKVALDSHEVSDESLYRQANEAKRTGLVYLQECLDYLRHTNKQCTPSGAASTRKFIAIGK